MFNAATKVVVGNVEHSYFWCDKWLDGVSLDIAPYIIGLDTPSTSAQNDG